MRLLISLIVLAALAAPAEAAEMRTWTAKNNKFSIKASLVDYKTKNGKIVLTLLRENKKKLDVKLSSLSSADKRYIANLIAAKKKEEEEQRASFKPGDGKDRALEFLAEHRLVEKSGVWILAHERTVKKKIDLAGKDFTAYKKAKARVTKHKAGASKHKKSKKNLRKEIDALVTSINADRRKYSSSYRWQQGTRKRRARQQELQRKLRGMDGDYEDQVAEDREEAGDARIQCQESINEVEDEFNQLSDQYRTVSKNKSILNAIKEVEGQLSPQDQFDRLSKKVDKLLVNFKDLVAKR